MENTKIFEEITEELRSIKENIAAEREALNAEKRALEQQKAESEAPKAKDTVSYRDVYNAMTEKRAITLNGTGSHSFVREIVKDAIKKHPLLEKARYFYGPSAQTNIPVLSPSIAVPAAYAEGTASGITQDAQAVLSSVALTPQAYVSILPVSDATLKFGYSNFESELPAIFRDAFADAMYTGLVAGAGSGLAMSGIFNSIAAANKTEIASTAPTMAEVAALALKLRDYDQNAVIIMNPSIYSGLVALAGSGNELDVYREELIRNKSIEGVPVVLTSYAPTATTAGAPLVVGLDMAQYALAIAEQISIEPIKKVGDLNTYFQATMYFNGKVVNPKNVWGLVVATPPATT